MVKQVLTDLDFGGVAQITDLPDANAAQEPTTLIQMRQAIFKDTAATLTRTGDKITSIAYASGASKVLTYTGDNLTQVDFTFLGRTVRRTYTYSGGLLVSYTETVL